MAETTDDRLRLLIERVERLENEKKGISDDIRDVYGEAKAVGYDPKIMRTIVRLRRMRPVCAPWPCRGMVGTSGPSALRCIRRGDLARRNWPRSCRVSCLRR